MGLARFFPLRDTYITNRIIDSPYNRATSASLGSNPTLQCLKVTSSFPTADAELARSLLQFDYNQLSGMVYQTQTIPQTGVQYVLKAFNYVIGDTTPKSYDLNVCAIAGPWDEGDGQDDINWTDGGYANWYAGTSTVNWTSGGGDYMTQNSGTQHFDVGDEDLEVDVTAIVQSWLTGSVTPNGLMIKLSNACESNGNDYFRKVFYSRETHTVEKIPFLEARWVDVVKDNRGNFAYNNPNALYLYNFVRGNLKNAVEPVTVRLQDNWLYQSSSFQQTYSASRSETGIYSAPITISTATPQNFSGAWVDIWQDGNGMCLMTGNLWPLIITGSQVDPCTDYVVNALGLKRVYTTSEKTRITVSVRRNFFNSHLAVHTASLDYQKEYIEDMFWSVVNNESGDVIIPFGTGSIPYTKLSYNKNGNYFDISMDSFVPGFVYKLLFLLRVGHDDTVVDEEFIFKVV